MNSRARAHLSIVIPVYNERATFEEMIERVLGYELPGIDREVLIVESNSTDGTREAVRRYESRPGVRVLWEDRPQGKGHAVRAALADARGDIVLIQDADLEYSVEDYPTVLEPILTGTSAFVLGSRHNGNGKIREFGTQRLLCWYVNLGHHLFTALVNVLCGTRLKDPFTMYKVFRRHCLEGVHLRRNRFDFDFELVVKLIRAGHVPIEVPVTYRSRSFAEGKKVRPLRDPIVWLWAAFSSRFERL